MTSNQKDISPIVRLKYTSRATGAMGTVALFGLLNQARTKNAKLGLTGHLHYADGLFTQCLEGPASAIDFLWESLIKDPRHDEIKVMERGVVRERRFDEWAMAFSSYRYLNTFNMPGFFPLDTRGMSEKSGLCAVF
jgi:hypothetical protein